MVANFRVYGNISPIVFAQKTHLLMHRNKILGGNLMLVLSIFMIGMGVTITAAGVVILIVNIGKKIASND
jgi:hypothetical protein